MAELIQQSGATRIYRMADGSHVSVRAQLWSAWKDVPSHTPAPECAQIFEELEQICDLHITYEGGIPHSPHEQHTTAPWMEKDENGRNLRGMVTLLVERVYWPKEPEDE